MTICPPGGSVGLTGLLTVNLAGDPDSQVLVLYEVEVHN
jgi:hypothetical protein